MMVGVMTPAVVSSVGPADSGARIPAEVIPVVPIRIARTSRTVVDFEVAPAMPTALVPAGPRAVTVAVSAGVAPIVRIAVVSSAAAPIVENAVVFSGVGRIVKNVVVSGAAGLIVRAVVIAAGSDGPRTVGNPVGRAARIADSDVVKTAGIVLRAATVAVRDVRMRDGPIVRAAARGGTVIVPAVTTVDPVAVIAGDLRAPSATTAAAQNRGRVPTVRRVAIAVVGRAVVTVATMPILAGAAGAPIRIVGRIVDAVVKVPRSRRRVAVPIAVRRVPTSPHSRTTCWPPSWIRVCGAIC